MCIDYHRWQQSWNSSTNLRGKVFAEWTNNDGPPSNWGTGFRVRMVPEGSSVPGAAAAIQTFAMDEPTPPAATPAEAAKVGFGPWGITMDVRNDTPYTLERVMDWGSQGTRILQPLPPKLPPGAERALLYMNLDTGHGPALLSVYDTFSRATAQLRGRGSPRCGPRPTATW